MLDFRRKKVYKYLRMKHKEDTDNIGGMDADRETEENAGGADGGTARAEEPSGAAARTKKSAVLGFIKGHAVLLISAAVAVATCFFVPPDAEYGGYFDLETLSCLFCIMAVVGALRIRGFFEWLAGRMIVAFGNMRRVTFALVFIAYFGSMIMGNDVALVTFLPLAWFVLSSCGRERHTAFVFVMQNIAANLGGMLTPFGNPQNLYLYSYYSIPAGEFFAIMALPFVVAFVLIAATCMFVRPEPVRPLVPSVAPPPVWRVVGYFALFALAVMIVFGVLPFWAVLTAVSLALLVLEPRSFLRVDYGMLLTFCAFFVFSGNLSRVPAVRAWLGGLIGASPLLVGTATCQVMSNVPAAVLLSHFTTDYRRLLIAVNIGGLGTPIASLAGLITLDAYRRRMPGSTARYLGLFSAINFSYLAVLIGAGYLTDLIFI